MNRNYLIGFAVCAGVLALLAFVAWSLFEVVPETKQMPVSREARTNEYLALDRWLKDMGRPVRVEDSGDLALFSRAEEPQIFVQASLFRWTDKTVPYLTRWVEEGGDLILSLDYHRIRNNDEVLLLLEQFGIEAKTGSDQSGYHYDPDSPVYDRNVSFKMAEVSSPVFTLKDRNGIVRLVQVKSGKGRLTVTGVPRFLLSSQINMTPNARLAWALFADRYDTGFVTKDRTAGCLFIRGTTKVQGIIGSLFKQGNMAVLLVSVLVLLVVGFWAALPVFGLVRGDDEQPGKPLRERFLAEGRFLKRYGALEFYCSMYVREIKRRLIRKEGFVSEDEILSRVHDLWEGKDSLLLNGIFRGDSFAYREFPKMIVVLKTILERI